MDQTLPYHYISILQLGTFRYGTGKPSKPQMNLEDDPATVLTIVGFFQAGGGLWQGAVRRDGPYFGTLTLSNLSLQYTFGYTTERHLQRQYFSFNGDLRDYQSATLGTGK